MPVFTATACRRVRPSEAKRRGQNASRELVNVRRELFGGGLRHRDCGLLVHFISLRGLVSRALGRSAARR